MHIFHPRLDLLFSKDMLLLLLRKEWLQTQKCLHLDLNTGQSCRKFPEPYTWVFPALYSCIRLAFFLKVKVHILNQWSWSQNFILWSSSSLALCRDALFPPYEAHEFPSQFNGTCASRTSQADLNTHLGTQAVQLHQEAPSLKSIRPCFHLCYLSKHKTR